MSRVKDETISGVKWTLLRNLSLHPIVFIFGVIMARLLSPDEMGVMGLTAVFFAIAAQLQSCDLGVALIRKQDRTEADINTVFWFNIGASFILSSIIFLCAPLFVTFFNDRVELLNLTRVSAVIMFLGASMGVHQTLFKCRRDFKTPAIISVVVTLISLPVGVSFAYLGFSYWSLVIQSAVSTILSLVLIWKYSPWRPSFVFSYASFKELFSFSSKMMLSSLINTFYFNVKDILIGKAYTLADLALYQRGAQMSDLPSRTINNVLGGVSLPIFATLLSEPKRLFEVYQKYIAITSLWVFWGGITISALSEPIVNAIYGAKWAASYPYLQIMVFSTIVLHIAALNDNLITIMGRSDVILKLEIIKKCYSIVLISIGIYLGVYELCVASLIGNVVATWLNVHYSRKLFGFSTRRQLSVVVPYFLLALVAAAPGYILTFTPLHHWIQLIVGGSISALIYFGVLRYRRDDAYLSLVDTAHERGLFRYCPFMYPLVSGRG